MCLTAHPELALGDDLAVAAGELAHHWHAAGRLQSLAASVRAGQAAELAHTPIEAQVHYRRALDLWAQVDDAAAIARVDRLWLLEQAAEVASLAGSHHAAVQLADQLLLELDAGSEAERHARILSRRALYSRYDGDPSMSPAATEVLRGGVDSGVTLAAVTRLCGVAYQSALELRYLEALALANYVLAAAREIGGPAELGHALHVIGSLQGHLGRYDDGIGQLHRSLELATEVGDKERIGSTWHNLVEAYVFAGRTEEAATLARQGVADLQDMGLRRTYAALTAGQHALALVALGRWTEADAVGAAVLGGNVDPYFALPLNFARLQLMVRRGDDEHADRLLGDLAESFAGNAYATAVRAGWEAELALWRRGGTRPGRRRSRPDDHRRDRRGELELRLAGVAARRGGPLRLDPCRRRDGRPWCRGRADRKRGAWCRDPPYRAWRRRSAARRCRSTGRSPSPRRGGSTVGAAVGGSVDGPAGRRRRRSVLRGLRPMAGRRGAARHRRPQLEERRRGSPAGGGDDGECAGRRTARCRGRWSGAPRRDRDRRSRDGHRRNLTARRAPACGLTAREIEVLRLIGEGRSNREIGEALFISAKTASVHVTHILQKLNVSTWVQAAIAADRLALG